MDIGTIIGALLGLGLVAAAILMGGAIGGFVDIPGSLVVIGGTVAASLVMYPLKTVLGTFKVGINVVTVKLHSPDSTITKIVELATKARKESVLALESEEFTDNFLAKGIRLCVDGTDPSVIKKILSTELNSLRTRHKLGSDVFDNMGVLAPAWGMIGTLIGLVQMLQNLADPSSIGPAMAVALLTTFYGALLANLVFFPASVKLSQRSKEEALIKEIIIEGVISIAQQENPNTVQDKLDVYLSPSGKPKEK